MKGKKTTQIALLAGAGVLAYFLLRKKGAEQIESAEEAKESEETSKEGKKLPTDTEVDAVVDSRKFPTTYQAVEHAKELATELKNGNVIVKTPLGEQNIQITTGAKKLQKLIGKKRGKKKKRLSLEERKTAQLEKIKKRKEARKKRKETRKSFRKKRKELRRNKITGAFGLVI